MTSINSMKFNEYEGCMTCDEQRGWNDENMKFFLADKIKSIIPDSMVEHLGIVAAYANTGTSSIGDELRTIIKENVQEKYEKNIKKSKKALLKLFTMDYIAEIVQETIVNLKHRHIDEELKSKFGFSSKDFIRGYYMKNGKKIEINDKDIKKDAYEYLTWENSGKKAQGVFLNSGIMSGFSPDSGFKTFHFDITTGFYEEVAEIFTAQGSGTMRATPVLSEFTSEIDVRERNNIDRKVGLYGIIDAVNEAKRKNIGVGGYPNIIVINGKEKDNKKRIIEFNDHRAKLASEIVESSRFGYIKKSKAIELLNSLIYDEKDFISIYKEFESSINNKEEHLIFLRKLVC